MFVIKRVILPSLPQLARSGLQERRALRTYPVVGFRGSRIDARRVRMLPPPRCAASGAVDAVTQTGGSAVTNALTWIQGAWEGLYTMPPGATAQQALQRSVMISSTTLTLVTIAVVLGNPKTRAKVQEAVDKPFRDDPGLRARLQQSMAWLSVVAFAGVWQFCTGQTAMLNMVWVALFAHQIQHQMGKKRDASKPKEDFSLAAAMAAANAATGNAPKANYPASPTPNPSAGASTYQNIPFRDYGAELTFRNRFPQLERESLVEVMGSCMLSEWVGSPGGAGTNTSGQVYITNSHICFHATMKKKQLCIPMDEVINVERIASGPLVGARLQNNLDQYFDLCTPMIGAPADLYDLLRKEMTGPDQGA